MAKKTTPKKTVAKKTATKKVPAKKNVTKKAPAVPVVPPAKTQGEVAWDEIKDLRLEMFGLPGQFVHTYYKPLFLDPAKLHLTALTKATSALSALEIAVSPKYIVELSDRFVVVSLAPVK